MKVLLLLTLAGVGSALDAACLQGEFAANGYRTGQSIEMNYEGTQISKNSGETDLTVAFFVPKLFTEQYDAASYAITFNRAHTTTDSTTQVKDWQNQVVTTALEDKTNQAACYTNRPGNYTFCEAPAGGGLWSAATDNAENPCISDHSVTIAWTEALTNEAFGKVDIKDDGTFTEVFLTATVETWRKFRQEAGSNYVGQMTGNVQLNEGGNSRDRTGSYFGDGGDLDVVFDPIEMDDWRYTLYQIPFILRFPKTVIVETDFTVGSKVTMLNGVVNQDVINVNLNPEDTDTPTDTFASLDVTVFTEVQYPYAVRSPDDLAAKMTVVQGDSVAGGIVNAESIEFLNFDEEGVCGGLSQGEICRQSFTMRIVPTDDNPCSVAGKYTMEMWAQCVGGPGVVGCGLDDKISESDIVKQRDSNGYFSLTFEVKHQSFCPEVIDTVHVASDFKAYHDEGFTVPIENVGNANRVFSNDVIFYEATYRTASEKSGQTIQNNDDGDGDASIIDYVRAVKIFVDVTIGVSAEGVGASAWDSSDWKKNLSWDLGGSRVAGEGDFQDASTTISGDSVLEITQGGHTDRASYRIILCEVLYITADVALGTLLKADDCFEAQTDLANDYLDFDKVDIGSGVANTIDENEVAFKMRHDERIIPVGPKTDDSHITVTLEAEVYYKGNKHPTRRLLQVERGPTLQSQRSVQSLSHSVNYRKPQLETCYVDDELRTSSLDIVVDYGSNAMPDLASANSWATSLKYELMRAMSVENAIDVFSVKKCEMGRCKVIIDSNVRRLQASPSSTTNELQITLLVHSTRHTSAGKIVNSLQSRIQAGTLELEMLTGEITHMRAVDCGQEDFGVHADDKLASSAAALSSLFALISVLVACL